MKQQKGFTLIELLVVIAIIGVIAAYAVPSYQQSVLKSGRSEAHAALTHIASIQERYYANNNRYGTAAEINLSTGFPTPTTANKKKYTITMARTNSSYTITATPFGGQAKDTACPTIGLDNIGRKTPNANCW